MKKRILLIKFDITATEQDAAKCMDLIDRLEDASANQQLLPNVPEEKWVSCIEFTEEQSEAWLRASGTKKYSNFITSLESSPTRTTVTASARSSIALHARDTQIVYYFRVAVTETSYIDLLHISLVIQRYRNKSQNEFFAYIAGASQNLYFMCSHFLCLLQSEYECFYCNSGYGSSGLSVSLLSTKQSQRFSSFFPLFAISKSNFKLLCSETYKERFLRDENMLLQLYESEGQEKQRNISSLLYASSERILANYLQINNAGELPKDVADLLQKIKAERSLLEYALACLIVPTMDDTKKEISSLASLSAKIFAGLQQALENVLIHSEDKQGLFLLRLHHKEDVDLQKKFPGAVIGRPYIELTVVDTNLKATMVDSFLANSKHKDAITACGDPVHLPLEMGHFFTDYGDNEKARDWWTRFRQSHPGLCHGLPTLADGLRQLKGIITAKSTRAYQAERPLVYCKDFSENSSSGAEEASWSIPGTRLSILYDTARFNDITFSGSGQQAHEANQPLEGGSFEAPLGYARYIESKAKCLLRFDDLDAISQKFGKDPSKKHDIVSEIHNKIAGAYRSLEHNEYAYISLCKIEREGQNNQKTFSLPESMFAPLGQAVVTAAGQLGKEKQFIIAVLCLSEAEAESVYQAIMLNDPVFEHGIQVALYFDGNEVLLLGRNTLEIKHNAFQWGFARGYLPDFIVKAESAARSMEEALPKKEVLQVVPLDTMIPIYEGESVTVFDAYIEKITENPLSESKQAGYHLEKTHMRLGSKVHLEDFYEASILFQKPRIALKVALQVLRHLTSNKNIDLARNRLVFYGYASYSRLILSSLIEILTGYPPSKAETEEENTRSFIIYQNDLSAAQGDDIHLYYSDAEIRKNPATLNCPPPDNPTEQYKIIQIVPISSTLSTFKKMWNRLWEAIGHPCGSAKPVANYAVFWVYNVDSDSDTSKSTGQFTVKVDEKARTLKTNYADPPPVYFVSKRIKWYPPEQCALCYPEYVLDERPLIETDQTSTVAAIQLQPPARAAQAEKDKKRSELNLLQHESEALAREQKNFDRLLTLEKCVFAGHLIRGSNHFQYYVDTSALFLSAREEIKKWISDLSRKEQKPTSKPIAHMIVTPSNESNVEFFQYIYNYYFKENANIIAIDTLREYRSNFSAKYADIKEVVRRAVQDGYKVQWHYVDDTIISGTNFWRSCSLIQSMCQRDGRKPFQFSNIFVLVNRLSKESKKSYIKDPDENFHSYADLYLSSMRSRENLCVCCNLQKSTHILEKKASTKYVSEKLIIKEMKYEPIPFYQWTQQWNDAAIKAKLQCRAFCRLVCSHLARYWLDAHESSLINMLALLDMVIDAPGEQKKSLSRPEISDAPLAVKAPSEAARRFLAKCLSELCGLSKKNDVQVFGEKLVLESFLKVLSRPYFSYKQYYRTYIFSFLIILAQSLLKEMTQDKAIAQEALESNILAMLEDSRRNFLTSHENPRDDRADMKTTSALTSRLIKYILDNYHGKERLDFLCNYALEGLSELRSNYLLREQTLLTVYEICRSSTFDKETIDEFLKKYTLLVQQLIDSSSDEAKSMRLHTLLSSGEPNSGEDKKISLKKLLLHTPASDNPENEGRNSDSYGEIRFTEFLRDLFIENTRVHYDGFRDLAKHIGLFSSGDDENLESGAVQSENDNTIREKLREAFSASSNNYFLNNLATVLGIRDKDYFVTAGSSEVVYGLPLEKLPESKTEEEEIENVVLAAVKLYCRLKKARKNLAQQKKYTYHELEKNLSDLTGNMAEIVASVQKGKSETSYFDVVTPREAVNDDIVSAIQNSEAALSIRGYVAEEDFVIIKLNNNYECLNDAFKGSRIHAHTLPQITPVYLYFELSSSTFGNSSDKLLRSLQIARRVLVFRNMLVQWIQSDFHNNTLPDLYRIEIRAKILGESKAQDHTSQDELGAVQNFLCKKADATERELERLALLKLYVNQKIARMHLALLHLEENAENPFLSPTEHDDKVYNRYFLMGMKEQRDKQFINLGEAFFGALGASSSRLQYLVILEPYFTCTISLPGKTESCSLLGLEPHLRPWDAISVDGKRYRAEDITLLFVEALFSAVKYGPPFKGRGDRADLLEVFRQMRDREAKYEVTLSFEESDITLPDGESVYYLVIKNLTTGGPAPSAENTNGPWEYKAGKDGGGISLAATRRYIQHLPKARAYADAPPKNADVPLEVKYFYGKSQGTYLYFIQKFPILRSRKGE